MDNSEHDWEDQLAEFMLGGMDEDAASRFARQLEECRTHVTLANEYSQVVGWLGAAPTPAEPPRGHKSRLMARVTGTPQQVSPASEAGDSARPSTPVPSVSAVQTEPPGAAPAQKAATIADLAAYRERRIAPAVWAVATAAAVLVLAVAFWLGTALAPRTIPADTLAVTLQGQGPQPGASAVLLVSPNTNQAVLATSGLQPLSADKVYEMWFLQPNGQAPVPAGVFSVGASGQASHSATAPSSLSNYTGVAVTVEQAPGGTAPKGDIVLAGNYRLP